MRNAFSDKNKTQIQLTKFAEQTDVIKEEKLEVVADSPEIKTKNESNQTKLTLKDGEENKLNFSV